MKNYVKDYERPKILSLKDPEKNNFIVRKVSNLGNYHEKQKKEEIHIEGKENNVMKANIRGKTMDTTPKDSKEKTSSKNFKLTEDKKLLFDKFGHPKFRPDKDLGVLHQENGYFMAYKDKSDPDGDLKIIKTILSTLDL